MKTPETSRLFVKRTDPESGVDYYVLSERYAPYQQGFYFVNNSMTADGRYLWFVLHYPPLDQSVSHLAYVDFETDEVVVCYDTVNGANYVDVCTGTGMSTATISRVSKCLEYGKGGYDIVIERTAEGSKNEL